MLSTPIKPSPERTTRTHLRSHNQGDVATSSPLSPMLGIGTRIAIASTTAHLRMPAAHDLPQTSATSSGASESNTEEHQYEAASQSMQQLQPEPAAPILPAVVDSQSVPKWLLGIPTITADDASLVDHGSSSSSSAGSSSTRSSSNAAMEEAQMMRRNPPPPPSSAATSAGPSRDPSPEPRSPVALALPVTLSLHRSASAGEVPSIPRGGGASDGGVDGDGPPNLGLGAPPINGFSSRPTSMATMNLTGKVASAVASSSPAAASTSLAKDLNPIQATALVGSPPGIALSRDWDGSGKSHASYSTSDSGDPARGATSKGATRPQHVRRQQPPQQQQQESGPTASISSTGMRGILAGGGSRRPVLAGGGSSLWASHSDRSIVGQSDMSAGSLSGRRTRRESETSEPGGQTGTMSSNSGRLQSSLNHPRSPTLDRLAPSGGGKRIDANQGPIISRLSESYRGQRSSRLSIRGSRQGGLISSGDVLGHRSSSTSMQSVPAVLRPFAHLWLKLDEIYQHQIHTPNTRFWSVWSSLILAIEVYNVFSVPFSMAWICHFTIAPYYMYFGYIIDLLLLVDVWLSMRQSFEDEYGVLITEPSEIRRHYLTQGHGTFAILGSIPFDLLALLPPLTRKEPLECTRIFFPGTATFGFFYDVTRIPGYLYAWSFLRLTRWFRVPKLLRRFASWNAKWVGGVTHMRLLKNFIVFLIAGHIDACLFFVLNVWEPIGTAWIDTIGIRNFTNEVVFLTQYYVSYLSALQSIVYVFRQIGTNTERVYTMVEIIIGSVIYGSIFGVLSNFIRALDNAAALDKKSEKHRYRMGYLRKFLRAKDFPVALQQKIIEHEEFCWLKDQGMSEDQLFSNLPPSLKQEVCNQLYLDLVDRVRAFREIGDSAFKSAIARSMKSMVVPADFDICYAGEAGHEMYFVRTGQLVAVVAPQQQQQQSPLGGGGTLPGFSPISAVPSGAVVTAGGDSTFALGPPTTAPFSGGTGVQSLAPRVIKIGVGAVFGDRALLQNARHNASIRTLTSVELCVLTRAALNEVCLQHPSAAQMLKQILESQRIAAFATASAAAAAKVRKLRPVQVRARASSRNIASIVGLAQRSSHNNNSTNGRGGSTTPLDGERALPAVVIGTISRGLSTILRMSGQRPKGAFTLDAKDHDDSLRRTDQTTDDEGAGGTLGAGWAKTVSSSIQNLAGGVKQAVIGSRTQLSSQ